MTGVNCPPWASVCEVVRNHKPMSRGHIDPTKPLVTSENGKVILKYSTNEVCPTNNSAFISTSIVFSCSSSDQQLVSPINRSSTSLSTSH